MLKGLVVIIIFYYLFGGMFFFIIGLCGCSVYFLLHVFCGLARRNLEYVCQFCCCCILHIPNEYLNLIYAPQFVWFWLMFENFHCQLK